MSQSKQVLKAPWMFTSAFKTEVVTVKTISSPPEEEVFQNISHRLHPPGLQIMKIVNQGMCIKSVASHVTWLWDVGTSLITHIKWMKCTVLLLPYGSQTFQMSQVMSGFQTLEPLHISQTLLCTSKNAQLYHGSDSVMVGNGEFLPISHTGPTSIDSSSGMLHVKDFWFILVLLNLYSRYQSSQKIIHVVLTYTNPVYQLMTNVEGIK